MATLTLELHDQQVFTLLTQQRTVRDEAYRDAARAARCEAIYGEEMSHHATCRSRDLEKACHLYDVLLAAYFGRWSA